MLGSHACGLAALGLGSFVRGHSATWVTSRRPAETSWTWAPRRHPSTQRPPPSPAPQPLGLSSPGRPDRGLRSYGPLWVSPAVPYQVQAPKHGLGPAGVPAGVRRRTPHRAPAAPNHWSLPWVSQLLADGSQLKRKKAARWQQSDRLSALCGDGDAWPWGPGGRGQLGALPPPSALRP